MFKFIAPLIAALVIPLTASGGIAMAAVTADINSQEAGGAANGGMDWDINYDDTTRAVTATASGSGFAMVVIQVTATISRTVVFVPASGATSQNLDIAAAQATADFTETTDGQPHVLLSGIAPNAVKRLLGKATATIGGFESSSEWSRI